MTKLGLTINENKTSLKDARRERFDFLGYAFGPHYPYKSKPGVRQHMSASPSKKSVQRLKAKVRELLVPSNTDPWPEVRDDLNRSLRGWSNYFNLGSPVVAFRSVDYYVRERVRAFLARRHKVAGRGNRRFTWEVIHQDRGVLCLERLPRPAPLWASQ
jgi:RNA-directed DNA polymerase